MAKNEQEELLPSASMVNYGRPHSGMHMQTYTAGEDGSRLANMAKEFGLQQQRQPRNQVRARVKTPLSALTGFYYERMLDPGFADVRMRAVFSAHSAERAIDDEGNILMGRLPSWKEDERDQDPHAHGLGGDMTSAVLGIIKGMVGPAILYLPHGFANAGFVASIPIMIVATVLFLSSSACLLDSWKHESLKETRSLALLGGGRKRKRTILSYPELAYRALGSTGEAAVKIGIALMQSGVCLTYVIFVSQNLQACTAVTFGRHLPAYYFTAIMVLFQIPLSWIRDIRKLTLTNLIANILILYGLIACLVFAFTDATSSKEGRSPLSEIGYKFTSLDAFNSGWFLFIGTCVSPLPWFACKLLRFHLPHQRHHLVHHPYYRFCFLKVRLHFHHVGVLRHLCLTYSSFECRVHYITCSIAGGCIS
jgi:proton-coupled amino acid transporter